MDIYGFIFFFPCQPLLGLNVHLTVILICQDTNNNISVLGLTFPSARKKTIFVMYLVKYFRSKITIHRKVCLDLLGFQLV